MKKFYLTLTFSFIGLLAMAQPPDNIISATCFAPPVATAWDIRELGRSTVQVHSYAQPLVGDLDGDGKNEVIAFNFVSTATSNSLIILNDTLGLKATIAIPTTYNYLAYPISFADVDKDGKAEIFVVTGNTTTKTLQCYYYNGTSWVAKPGYTAPTFTVLSNRVAPAPVIGDINGDGIPEIFVYDRIFNAQTGALIAALPAGSSKGGYSNAGDYTYYPVLADVDNDGILDIVVGNQVYKANIANGSLSGSVTLYRAASIAEDGFTSVADIDLDGYLDVIVTFYNSGSKGYVWSPYKNTLIGGMMTGVVGIENVVSRSFIGDVDNDGYPEIAFSYENGMVCYKYNYPSAGNLGQLWRHTTTDASGMTTMSMFDFNQDGKQEIIYRDETHLRIMNGETGLNRDSILCYSGTASEMPIVVDLSGVGNAQILVSGAPSSVSPNTNCVIRRYGSNTPGAWASARKVWHQHAYNAVNINENLTVPTNPINPATVFSGPNGVLGDADDVRPFNGFLMQQTVINAQGVPFFLLPGLTIDNTLVLSMSNDTVKVTGCLINSGEVALQSPIYVTFYKNDTLSPANIVKLDSINHLLLPGSTHCFSLSLSNFKQYEPLTSIWVSLNDKNGVYPYQQQCVLNGRREISVKTVCAGTSVTFAATPTNGGGTPTYQWYVNGSAIGGATATTYTYVPANGDEVTVKLTSTAGCANPATVTHTVTVIAYPLPSVNLSASPSTLCAGGSSTLTANVSGGTTTPMTYTWYIGGSTYTSSSNTYNLSGLTATANYSVKVTNANGCEASATTTVTVNPLPVVSVTASPNPVCSGNPTTFTATVSSGAVNPMTYTWNIAGTTYTSNTNTYSLTLSGTSSYSVMVTNNNGCASTYTAPQTVSVTPTVVPSISINASTNNVCSGTTVTFSPTTSGGGSSPTYQWYVNGLLVGSGSSYTYAPANNDVVTCKLTSSDTCANPNPVTSAGITMIITPTVIPSLTITAVPD